MQSRAGCSCCNATVGAMWRASVRPDSNLGKGSVGPSREKTTYASALRLLSTLGVDDKSVFLDIGCGHGLVCVAAAVHSNALCSLGVDLAVDSISWADRAILKTFPETALAGRCILLALDVTLEWRESLNTATHIYCNNRDFPPEVLAKVAERLYASQGHWKRLASAKPRRAFLEAMALCKVPESSDLYNFWSERVRAKDNATDTHVNLCGSGQRIGIYLIDNIYTQGSVLNL